MFEFLKLMDNRAPVYLTVLRVSVARALSVRLTAARRLTITPNRSLVARVDNVLAVLV